MHVIHLTETDSTNRVLLDLASQGAADWTVIRAEAQTAGRGRLQRQWLSPPGAGLYFSVLFRPALDPVALPLITLAAGVAVCEVLERCAGTQPRLKWPNDIHLDRRKVGGILTETSGVGGQPRTAVVVGVGLNVSMPAELLEAELQDRATSLHLHWREPVARELLVTEIVSGLRELVAMQERGEAEEVLRRWRLRDGLLDRWLHWLTPEGQVVHGRGLGLDGSGRYRVEDRQGKVHEVLSGDLTLQQT